MSQTPSRMVLWLICVGLPCCGGPLLDCDTPLHSNSWSPFARSWTQPGPSVLWASTLWPSPVWPSVKLLTRNSPGSMSIVAMSMATTTGATARTRVLLVLEAQHQPAPERESALCVGEWAPMCHCGWAVREDYTWMLGHPLTLSVPAAMFAQKRQWWGGARSRYPTAPMPSTLPALSVAPGWLENRAILNSSSKALLTKAQKLKQWYGRLNKGGHAE